MIRWSSPCGRATLYCGDCRIATERMEPGTFDTVITDPPYGIAFMGKGWDRAVPGEEFWKLFNVVAKPGATLLSFGGTRTFHRLACAIEDSGWEIRDCLMWLYGTGFPKSHNISKAIDAAAGAEREVVGTKPGSYPAADNTIRERSYGISGGKLANGNTADRVSLPITAPATDDAKKWDGWGTALKPAWEPIIMAMAPTNGTFAENALAHGVAGLWIDGNKIGTEFRYNPPASNKPGGNAYNMAVRGMPQTVEGRATVGRWPSNLVIDEESAALLGPPSRFFYIAKPSKAERGEGNNHPTLKPVALLEHLCRLTRTPDGGTVLDPFMGSGTTGVAAIRQGRRFVGVELDEGYFRTAIYRIKTALAETPVGEGAGVGGDWNGVDLP